MDLFLIFLGVVFGYALCWFTKDNVTVMVTGTEAFVKSLEAKVSSLKTAITPAAPPVRTPPPAPPKT
jgi:hypothetical protein